MVTMLPGTASPADLEPPWIAPRSIKTPGTTTRSGQRYLQERPGSATPPTCTRRNRPPPTITLLFVYIFFTSLCGILAGIVHCDRLEVTATDPEERGATSRTSQAQPT